jgi:glycosyltransferase involved in cell wall biosynthesis
VALLANNFGEPWAEGGKNNLRMIAGALAKEHECFVIGLGPRTEQLTVDGMDVYRYRSPGYSHRFARAGYPAGYAHMLRQAGPMLKERRPDLIFSYFETASTAFFSVCLRRLAAPQSKLMHTVWSDWFTPVHIPVRHWGSELLPQVVLNTRLQGALGLRGVDRVLVTSEHLAKRVASLGLSSGLTPTGVDTHRFAPDPDRTPPGSGDTYRVGYLGHTTYAKGVSLLLDAIQHLLGLEPSIRLALAVTPGAEETARVQTLKQPTIELEGIVDPAAFFNRVDLTVLPRRFSYGTASPPNVLLESMACGTPVLTANLPGIDEIITDGVNGFLFKPGDLADLRGCLVRLYRDRALLAEVGKRARERACELDWGQVLPAVLKEVSSMGPTT